MIDLPVIAENWQEEPRSYTLKRAIKEYTCGCPCDTCHRAPACRVTGYECARFKGWVSTGKAHAIR